MKKYKNIIILLFIIALIFSSTKVIDLAESIVKSIEKLFSQKTDYSNLSSQSHKFQNTFKSSKPTSSSGSSGKAGFSNKEKTAEELDADIMNNKNTKEQKSQRDIRFNEEKLKRDLGKDNASEEKFDMNFKELDKF